MQQQQQQPMPGWVKAIGAVALVLVVAFVVFHLTGNAIGGHGTHRP